MMPEFGLKAKRVLGSFHPAHAKFAHFLGTMQARIGARVAAAVGLNHPLQ